MIDYEIHYIENEETKVLNIQFEQDPSWNDINDRILAELEYWPENITNYIRLN